MRTDPPDHDPTRTSAPTERVPPLPPPAPPEPQRLHREAVLVVQDRGRMALLIGLCTLAGVAAGFALATVGARDPGPHVCEASALPAPAPAPPIQAQPAPQPAPGSGGGGGGGHGHGHGHGNGRGLHLHGPWGHYWSHPFDRWDIDIDRPHAWLGVTTVTDPAGAKITTVMPSSPAAAAGLKPDDIITEVNGEQVATPAQLADVVGDLAPGTKVKVSVTRGGKPMTLEATVAERP